MPLPSSYESTLPVLQYLADTQPHAIKKIVDAMATHFKLTPEEKEICLSDGKRSKFANIIQWSAAYLKKALLIKTVKWGIYQITDRGSEVLAQNPEQIDNKFLSEFPEYRSKKTNVQDRESSVSDDEMVAEATDTPEEIIDKNYEIIRQKLAEDLLARIQEKEPAFFERLVVKLLEKMGYGAGKAVGKSGDGGIDGTIEEDKLGLDKIYIQAKQYENSVPISDVRDFAGAMSTKKTKKGVFITTSSYSQAAYEFVKSCDSRIVLINGEQLAQLMIDHNLGVTTNFSYDLKHVDNDFFEED